MFKSYVIFKWQVKFFLLVHSIWKCNNKLWKEGCSINQRLKSTAFTLAKLLLSLWRNKKMNLAVTTGDYDNNHIRNDLQALALLDPVTKWNYLLFNLWNLSVCFRKMGNGLVLASQQGSYVMQFWRQMPDTEQKIMWTRGKIWNYNRVWWQALDWCPTRTFTGEKETPRELQSWIYILDASAANTSSVKYCACNYNACYCYQHLHHIHVKTQTWIMSQESFYVTLRYLLVL